MPQAVAHILIPLIFLSLIRDYYKKKNKGKTFSLHYVLIGGIAGIIPDLDIVLFWVLSFFGFTIEQIHRTFAHTIFLPLIFLLLGVCFIGFKNGFLGKHKLRISNILFLFALGCGFHLLLDGIFAGYIVPFYLLSDYVLGLNLFGYLPSDLELLAAPSLDAGLLIIWIIYLEIKHHISDFI